MRRTDPSIANTNIFRVNYSTREVIEVGSAACVTRAKLRQILDQLQTAVELPPSLAHPPQRQATTHFLLWSPMPVLTRNLLIILCLLHAARSRRFSNDSRYEEWTLSTVQAQVIIAVWKAVASRLLNLEMVIDATLIPKLLALSVLYLKPP